MNKWDQFADARAVVTGGSGFIGSHIVDALAAAGSSVVIVDTAEPYHLKASNGVEFVRADIRSLDAAKAVISSADFVFHHAAIASVPQCSQFPDEAYSVNTAGCATILRAVAETGSKARVLLASSAAVYGNSRQPQRFEESEPKTPHSIYGSSKALAEDVFQKFSSVFGVKSAIVRYANVYGPRQPRYLVYDMFHKVRAANGVLPVLGSGLQERDFVYVDDAVRMTLAAILHAGNEQAVFNIGTGRATNVIDAARAVAAAMGKSALEITTTGSSWLGDVDYLLVNTARANEALGGTHWSLEDGIKSTIEWFAGHAA